MLHKNLKPQRRDALLFFKVIRQKGQTGQNITDFDPNWAFPDYRLVAAFKSLRFALFKIKSQNLVQIKVKHANQPKFWLCFYQTRSAWFVDQGSNKNHSPAYNFATTVTKFCVMWEGLSLPYDTKFGNCRCNIVDSRAFPSWSLIHGLRWSGLIKAEPGFWSSPKKKWNKKGEIFIRFPTSRIENHY